MIRDNQMQLVNTMFNAFTSGQQHIVYQAIMGIGKTSVICPLLALALSELEPKRLVLVICQPSLMQQTSHQLQAKLCVTFQKQVSIFDFNRFTNDVASALKLLKAACNKRAIVCATPATIKSVFLRWAENPCGELRDMLRILNHSVAIFDEVDQILHPQTSELTFTLGEATPIMDNHQWCIPYFLSCAFLGEVDDLGELEGEHNRDLRIFFKHLHENYSKVVRKETRDLVDEGFYHKECLSTDVECDGVRLCTSRYPMKHWIARLLVCYLKCHFVIDLQEDSLKFIESDEDPESSKPDVEHFDILNRCRTWCKSLFPFIISRSHRVHYGIPDSLYCEDPERVFKAVPFVAKDIPSTNSNFSSLDVAFGFTALSYMKTGKLRLLDITKIVQHFQMEIHRAGPRDRERIRVQWMKLFPSDLPIHQQWHSDPLEIKSTDHIMLHSILAESKSMIAYYIKNIALPLMAKMHEKSMTTDAVDLCHMFYSVIGFSGTPSKDLCVLTIFLL
jgi:hypothetical protein